MNIPISPTNSHLEIKRKFTLKTSFAPLITYEQSAFLNLLIFRIFNVKDVDILHSFLRFVPIIFPVVNIAHIHLIFTKFVLYIHLIFT